MYRPDGKNLKNIHFHRLFTYRDDVFGGADTPFNEKLRFQRLIRRLMLSREGDIGGHCGANLIV